MESIKIVIVPVIVKMGHSHYDSIILIALISITIRSIALDIYDLKEADWFLISKIKNKKAIEKPNKFTKTIKILGKIGGAFIVFVFFIFIEPLIFILLARKDHKWNGLTFLLKIIFVVSNILFSIVLYFGAKSIIYVVTAIVIKIF
jgi:hypothetical protein